MTGSPDVDAFESGFLTPLEGLLNNQTRFALVIDAQNVTGVSMGVALRMVKWMRAHRDGLSLHLRGTGIVIVNDAVKAIMQFVMSLQTPTAPLHLAETATEAWNFVQGLE